MRKGANLSKYNTRREYMTENTVDWLKDFADKQGEKVAKDNNINPQEFKNAGYMENILDIVNRNKHISVEEKVARYRELAGLDLVENLEKEGGKEIVASHITLSIRDKIAKNPDEDNQLKDQIKQYIDQVIKNRNGSIAVPAILDQLNNYLKIDTEWLRAHLEEISQMVDQARRQVISCERPELLINDLARTDEPNKGEKEAPPFLPPPHQPT